jgi:hypothetical protein
MVFAFGMNATAASSLLFTQNDVPIHLLLLINFFEKNILRQKLFVAFASLEGNAISKSSGSPLFFCSTHK